MKKDKKVTWSKGMLLCSTLIFIAVIALVFWLYISGNIQNMYDSVNVYVPIDELLYFDDNKIKELVKNKQVRNDIIEETKLVSKIKILRKPNFKPI